MSNFNGSITVLGTIAPGTTADLYPTHEAIYGKGGSMQVSSILERNAISEERRVEGLLVTVYDNVVDPTVNGIYVLEGGITNDDWVLLGESSYFTAPNVVITAGNTAPLTRDNGTPLRNGDFWFDPVTTGFYIYYIDVDSSQWVQINENRPVEL